MEVNVYQRFDAMPDAAATAFSYRNGQPFFYSHEWFECLARFGLDEVMSPRVYVASDNEGPQCALYCATTRPRRLVSLTNFYTMQFAPVMAGQRAAAGLVAIVAQLARERWNTIDLRLLRDDDSVTNDLDHLLKQHGFDTFSYTQYDNWFLDVGGASFETYFRGLSSRLRNTIKRKGNKLRREHDVILAIYPRDDLSLEEGLEVYESVYQGSWKQAEPFPEFMPALFRLCDGLGNVRVGVARIDGEPAAAQIWVNDHGRTLIYKLAYDDKYAPHSIGSVLSREMFQHAIEADEVTEIDYGVGSEPYKADWMSDVRQLGGLLACNRTTVGGQLARWRQKVAEMTRDLRNKGSD